MTARWLRWPILAALVALVASVGLAAARLGWHMAGHTTLMPQPLGTMVPATQDATPDTAAILALAPFGASVAPDAPPAAPETSVLANLTLRGVLVDPDPARSRAFIADGTGTATYRMDESIGVARITRITEQSVTLAIDDDTWILRFDGAEAPDTATGAAPPATDANDPLSRLAASIVAGNGSIDLRDAPPPETTQDYIALWRDRITRNPQDVIDRIGVEVVEDGYKVKADPNIGVTLAGLRPGDVVTRLNGQIVGDLEADRRLYDEVAAAGIARLEVVRDGQTLLLAFPLR